MGITALILGIVSIILIFIPFIWITSIITAITGLTLGILSIVKKKEKGIVCLYSSFLRYETSRRLVSIKIN